MSGNGGSAGYQDLATYQKSFHSLLLLGVNASNKDWLGQVAETGYIVTAVINAGGTGYTTGDLVAVGGAYGTNGILEVTASAGVVTALEIIAGGNGYKEDDGLATAKITGSGNDDLTVDITVTDTSYASSNEYKDNPSIARFILERGLSDVGGNPFSGRLVYNPDALLDEITEQVQTLRRQIEDLDLGTDLGADYDTAIAETASASDIATVASAAVTQALTYAANLVSTALNNAQTKALALAPAVHGVVDARETAWSAATLTTAIAGAKTAYADVFDNLEVMSPATTAQSDATTALAALLPSIDSLMNIAIQIARQASSDVINSAMQNALMMLDEAFIGRAIQNYERRGLRNFLRNVNRFTAPMADMGAVDGSSYVIGMALLHSDFQADISDFQSKLELQLYSQLFDAYVSFSASTMNSYLQTYGQQYALKVGLYDAIYEALTGQSQQSVAAYARLVETVFSGKTNAYKMLGLENAYIDLSARAEVNTAESSANRYIDQAMRERLVLLTGGLEQLFNRRQLELNANSVLANTVAETNRVRLVAKTEEKNRQDEYDIKESTWDLELFQLAGNVLSAVSGSVVPTAAKPSTWQTVLGGALAVGSVAASIATMNPAPAAAGVSSGVRMLDAGTAQSNIG